MKASSSPSAPRSVGASLRERIHQRFVGRAEELAALREALREAGPEPRFVHVRGPAGVGKTTLAEALRFEAEAEGHAVYWVSGERTAPNPRAFVDRLRLSGVEDPAEIGRGERPDLVVIDAFEELDALAHWLFSDLLADAGSRLLVVLTSRHRLDLRTRSGLSVQPFLRELALRNLSDPEVLELLSRQGVPASEQERVARFTRGLPLALSLVLERHRAGAPLTLEVSDLDDVAPSLISDLVSRCPTDLHRDALWALSLPRTADRRLLAAMLRRDPRPLERWLAELEIVDQVEGGLRVHGVVREVLLRDLELRDPDRQRELAKRAADALLARLPHLEPGAQRQAVLDALYTRRNLPVVRDMLGLAALDRTYLRVAGDDDRRRAREGVCRHEGEEAAVAFDLWAEAQPAHLFVIHDSRAEPVAVVFLTVVSRAPDARGDPILERLLSYADANPAEEVACFRWFFAFDGYQDFGPDMSAAMFSGPVVLAAVEPPIPKHVFCCVSEPERWAALDDKMMMRGRPDLGIVELAGRRYGFAQCDLPDVDGPLSGELVIRETGRAFVYGIGELGIPEPEAPVEADAPLDRDAFEAAVREALAQLHQPHDLKQSPLASTRLVKARADADALGAALRDAIEALAESPAYRDSAEVLRVTYVTPAVKQHAAAHDLGLPYGTYRHRLRKAIALLVQELWERAAVDTEWTDSLPTRRDAER